MCFSPDVNECDVQSPCQHHCYNLIGSFLCQCDQGYELAQNAVSCQGGHAHIHMAGYWITIYQWEHSSVFFLCRYWWMQLLQLHVSVPMYQQPRKLLLWVSSRISAPGKQAMSRYCHPLFVPSFFFIFFPYFLSLHSLFIYSSYLPLTLSHQASPLLSHPSLAEGLGTSWFPLSSTQVGNESHSQPILSWKKVQRLGNTNTQQLCVALLGHLCEFICMMLVSWSGFIWSSRPHSKGELLFFSPPPRSGAGFIGGAMNLDGCVRRTFWGWIQVAVPEIALWFGACLMGLFSRCCNERAAVRLVWGCIGSSPWLENCRLPSFLLQLHRCWRCHYKSKTPYSI